ncbi:MAG: hypothetical protein FD147_178 [Chloroflexi bacterium]|nr:MAG: hypothetical protein FD147_178 [Chloroflexota bacterium]MBA4374776.1 hypothetical protein [Anaerolinea sp.]
MRTPAGIECPYFYGDYFRGRTTEECRLIGSKPPPAHWTPDLCRTCPVPGIVRANACEHMTLYPVIKKGFSRKKRLVKITAYCSKSKSEVATPEIGCGFCHQEIDLFEEPLE